MNIIEVYKLIKRSKKPVYLGCKWTPDDKGYFKSVKADFLSTLTQAIQESPDIEVLCEEDKNGFYIN